MVGEVLSPACQGLCGEELADLVERLDVGDRIRARRAPDRRLVDEKRVLEKFPPRHRFDPAHRLAEMALGRMAAMELALEIAVDHVVEERALSRARHTGDGGERRQGNVHVHVGEIVQRGATHPQPVGARRPPCAGYADALLAREILTGERVAGLRDRAGVNDVAATLSRAGAELDHEIGLADGAQIMLDHEHGVSCVAKTPEQRQQAVGVARMEADRGLIEDVQRVDQTRAQRVGQCDALGLATGEGAGLALEREIAQPDVSQKIETGVELVENELRHLALVRCAARGTAANRGWRPPAAWRQSRWCARLS